jgi:hypothetical protein
MRAARCAAARRSKTGALDIEKKLSYEAKGLKKWLGKQSPA